MSSSEPQKLRRYLQGANVAEFRYRADCNCGASEDIGSGRVSATFGEAHYEHGISIQRIIGPDLRERTAEFRRKHLPRSATS